MDTQARAGIRNTLLNYLSAEDFALIGPQLQPVELPFHFQLSRPHEPASHAYFLNTGIGSIITVSAGGNSVEAGLFGRDGMSPIHTVLQAESSSQEVVMQVAGDGYRMPASTLRSIIDENRAIRRVLLRYVQAHTTQTAFTALSNAIHKIDQRLARWLLMCHDRLEGDDIELTHEYLSIMLAVRRPSVTMAMHMLEGEHLIRSQRRKITILDRKRLEIFAADAYGTPEREYRRLMGEDV